jgi:hypothetical protein
MPQRIHEVGSSAFEAGLLLMATLSAELLVGIIIIEWHLGTTTTRFIFLLPQEEEEEEEEEGHDVEGQYGPHFPTVSISASMALDKDRETRG